MRDADRVFFREVSLFRKLYYTRKWSLTRQTCSDRVANVFRGWSRHWLSVPLSIMVEWLSGWGASWVHFGPLLKPLDEGTTKTNTTYISGFSAIRFSCIDMIIGECKCELNRILLALKITESNYLQMPAHRESISPYLSIGKDRPKYWMRSKYKYQYTASRKR